MARIMTVSDTVDINADADELYTFISDPTQMPKWSPENRGATILNPSDDGAAFVGMTFEGHNKRGRAAWTTRCTVTAADPGRRFAFTVHNQPLPARPGSPRHGRTTERRGLIRWLRSSTGLSPQASRFRSFSGSTSAPHWTH
jgi:uncharacterized protein YndB with AHSA1/START domain